ncbi:MAG: glucosidase [Planctomycetes bacterium]|nr:glucosidase [Planctomycetota bacterium]
MTSIDHQAEFRRLEEDRRREQNWKRWGPYLAERQWGTVREDYSADGDCWNYFPHDHARSRAYRWGEDGLLGITDRACRLCLALALWNGRDPILKERLFGLTGPEGNHGEDVKESYFYIDATPTHSYLRGLYRYPQARFPYEQLVHGNRERGLGDRELELADTGVFDGNRWFDVEVEYAKAAPDDVLVRITVHNRGPEAAPLHVLPQLWFRNTWSWGRTGEDYWQKPSIRREGGGTLVAEHASLGAYRLFTAPHDGALPEFLFTDNETNVERLFGSANPQPYVKDAFHRRVIHDDERAVRPDGTGTKAAAWYRLTVPAGGSRTIELRLVQAQDAGGGATPFGSKFDATFAARIAEADAFYRAVAPGRLLPSERLIYRQASAGLLWSKQFFHFDVRAWLEGDPAHPAPPAARWQGRNADWLHLYNRDVVSMPDKWEYPWYAAWDLAFHMLPFARLDPHFAKDQLLLLLREWYMLPNGQLPAYEFAFGDVNPPVHAWACWRVYKMTGGRGARDRAFLARAFQKLLLNFTWWVNRKDEHGKHLFSGGFLGLDNIGVFDRSRPLPTGGHLEQADGTAWMAFYCATMLAMALELAKEDPVYEDLASKFFEHFVAITDAINTLGGSGLWDEQDGFYYDQIHGGSVPQRLRVRSMVGIIPLFAAEILEQEVIDRLPGFKKRMQWFLANRPHLARHVSRHGACDCEGHHHLLLAIPSKEQLVRVLRHLLDEREFLSPFGVRSLSAVHREQPFVLTVDGREHRVDYVPGEGTTRLFGGNSNWRGPVWFPVNYLLIEALERYHHFYGDSLRVECPTGSGRWRNLQEVAHELNERLVRLFLPDPDGRRPCLGAEPALLDTRGQELVLFHEYFDGDTGRGCGASHQTGWTALVNRCLEEVAQRRTMAPAPADRAERPQPDHGRDRRQAAG